MKTRFLLVITAAMLLAACAPRVDTEAARAAILEADRQFSKATSERGLDGFRSFLADEVTTLRPDSPVIRGKDPFVERWAALLANPKMKITWEPELAEVSASGELGYTVGSYEITATNGLGIASTAGTGKYVTIWRKQADGSWKVVFDSGVQDTPRQEGPQPAKKE